MNSVIFLFLFLVEILNAQFSLSYDSKFGSSIIPIEANDSFQIVINTALGDGIASFTLPLRNDYDYNCQVNWGDGDTSRITAFGDTDKTHTYSSGGIYTISIYGVFQSWYFNNGGDKLKLTSITNLGATGFIDLSAAFYGCSNLTAINDTSGSWCDSVVDMNYMFANCTSFNSNLDNWNTSNVTNMNFMFFGCSIFNGDIGSWNTLRVNRMISMFSGASAFNQDIGEWDVDSVTDMTSMFSSAIAFNQDIGSWDVGLCENMASMFYIASAFNQDIGEWNMTSVTDINYMFYAAIAFNQDIGSWDVGSVTNMNSALRFTTVFNQDIGSWDMTSVITASSMLTSSGLSTANYDLLLNGWAAQTVKNTVNFGAGSIKYSTTGEVGRNILTGTYSWIITDGGLE